MNKKQRIFIHIPKCGGNTIKKYFNIYDEINNTHEDCNFILNYISYSKFLSFKPFTLVRNPFDRLVSWYFFHRELFNDDPILKSLYGGCFEDWINNGADTHWCKNSKYYHPSNDRFISNVWSQLDWITYNDKLLENVRVYKFERFFKKIKCIPQNKSNHASYKKYYTSKETINNAYNICKNDIEFYKYEF